MCILHVQHISAYTSLISSAQQSRQLEAETWDSAGLRTAGQGLAQ